MRPLRQAKMDGTTVLAPCMTCGGEIDAQIIQSKERILAKLYPGRAVPPPKRCSRCTWLSVLKFAFGPIQSDKELE